MSEGDKTHVGSPPSSSEGALGDVVASPGPSDLGSSAGTAISSESPPPTPRSSSIVEVELSPEAVGGEPLPLVKADDRTYIAKRVEGSDVSRAVVVSSPQDLGKALEGNLLDHYQLERFVGGGGMGAVFQAQDTRLGRVVAVKVLLRERADSDMVRRFQKEAQSAARLDHPNIARVHFVGECKGWNYIVFEYIEGRNLRQVVDEEGALKVDRALDYTQQIADALQHAADRDVVHRDIKPSNVLVTESGQVKLVDMGLARLHQVAEGDEALTNTGVTLGTFDYISPEQAIEPRSADVRSDLYSLGCTLYFMLAQRPPFPDGTALQKMLRHNGDDPPDIRLFRPELPDPVAKLVAKLLAKRPADRYQTPSELVNAIQSIAKRLGMFSIVRDASGNVATLAKGATHPAGSWARHIPTALALGLMFGGLMVWDATARSKSGDALVLPELPRWKAEAEIPVADTKASPVEEKLPREAKLPGDKPAKAPEKTPSTLPISTTAGNPTSRANREVGLFPPRDVAGLLAAPPGEFSLEAVLSRPLTDSSETPVSIKPSTHKLFRVGAASRSPNEIQADSLEQAINASRGLSGEVVIELATREEILEAGLDLGGRSYVIRGTDTIPTRIVFRAAPTTLSSNRFGIGVAPHGKVRFENLDLALELGEAGQSGWSLFRVMPGGSVLCNQCVMTLRSATGDDIEAADAATFGIRPVEPTRMVDDNGNPAGLVAGSESGPSVVSLTNCLVRGRGSLVTMTQSSALQLEWDGGLFASSGRLIDAGPSVNDSGSKVAGINVTLSRLTLVAPRGIARMALNPKNNDAVAVAVKMENCVAAVEPAVALFEFGELASLPERDAVRDANWIPFQFEGNWNAYEGTDTFLRAIAVKSPANPTNLRDFAIDERLPFCKEGARPSRVNLVRPTRTTLVGTEATDFGLEKPSTNYGHVPGDLPEATNVMAEPPPMVEAKTLEQMPPKTGAGAIMPPDMEMPETAKQ